MLKLNLQKFAVTGIGFDNIPYHAYTWADYDDDPLNRTTSMMIDYPAPNQIAFREGSRLRIGGHKMKVEGDQLITLPATVDVDTTFYFLIEIDVVNQKYSDIIMTEIEPIERGEYDKKIICPFGQIFVSAGNVVLGGREDYVGVTGVFKDYLVNLMLNPITHVALDAQNGWFGAGTQNLTPFEIMGKRYLPSDFNEITIWTSDYDDSKKVVNNIDFFPTNIPLHDKSKYVQYTLGFQDLNIFLGYGSTGGVSKILNLNDNWTIVGPTSNGDAAVVGTRDVVVRLIVLKGINPYTCGTPIE
jgi:hypothetical protein